LEAMACGVPVITANTSSMPEVAGEAALLVDPHDPTTLAELVGQLASDHQLRNELADKGITRAQRFSWSNTAANILDIYESIE